MWFRIGESVEQIQPQGLLSKHDFCGRVYGSGGIDSGDSTAEIAEPRAERRLWRGRRTRTVNSVFGRLPCSADKEYVSISAPRGWRNPASWCFLAKASDLRSRPLVLMRCRHPDRQREVSAGVLCHPSPTRSRITRIAVEIPRFYQIPSAMNSWKTLEIVPNNGNHGKHENSRSEY
jgi:hypothetical protein